MGKVKLRFRELETMLIQAEGVLNNRLLTYQGDHLEEEVITPNYLIHRAPLPTTAEHDSDSDEEIPLNKRVRYLQEATFVETMDQRVHIHSVLQSFIE